jgi:hypothetical protein
MQRASPKPLAGDAGTHTSFVIATIIPTTTKKTIATCIQIQLVGIAPNSLRRLSCK